ncbi:MAG TPA: lysylphosphatidylglycerol synthase transmembrane domain-containing protein [Thermomicrobiales bacterium]|nr:lysylphosphatidylglycerol synthase transmembrane domain-containing protein [Thermomicrobiales bacterium]
MTERTASRADLRVHFTDMPDRTTASLGDEGTTTVLWSRRAIAGIVLAVVVFSALALFGDVRAIGTAFRDFRWWLAPPIIALTLWNYCWRFVKWELYLRRLDVPRLPLRTSALIFLSAFSMSITPGKVGELVKSVYLKRFTGAPVNRTSAIIVAERATDALAMLVLAIIGLTQFSYARPFVGALAIVVVAGLALLQRPEALARVVTRLEARRVVGRVVDHALAFIEASGTLFRPAIVAQATLIGIISWMGECVAFYFVLTGLGLTGSWHLLMVATFTLAVSSLAGGASLLPGGLGVADASVAGMLLLLVHDDEMNRTIAAAATLLIRFATLWFAVLLGVVAVALLERRQPQGRTPIDGRREVRPTIDGGSL